MGIGTGTVATFNGEIELTGVVLVRDVAVTDAPPPPVDVAPADVATGGTRANALEGILLRVQNVTVTDVNPAPGPGDTAPTNEFVVGGSLRVNDSFYLVTPLPAVNATFSSIQGVLDFRNGNSKLEPRAASDVTQ